MNRWNSVKELMYDLVSVQSDTFSHMEETMADHFLEIIGEQEYFKEHPELFGSYAIPNDPFGRKSVWALRRGNTNKTIVMNGHMDCVEIDCYGELKKVALQPDALKPELQKIFTTGEVAEDLADEDWIFGRGVADMKGGVACILYTLFQGINPDVNLLFLTTPDEEHQSEGIMSCASLLAELKAKYDLEYKVALVSEPQQTKDKDTFLMSYGSIGKILPAIVARGRLTHVAELMKGLNSTLMIANVSRKIDLNADLIARDLDSVTPPPCVLHVRDDKETYNISTPLFSQIYAHIYISKSTSVMDTIGYLKELCKEAGAEAKEAYEAAYLDVYENQEEMQDYNVLVYTYEELDAYCKENIAGYAALKAEYLAQVEQDLLANTVTIQQAGFAIIQKTILWSEITEPIYVVGLLPPYCPAVNSVYFSETMVEDVCAIIQDVVGEKYNMQLEKEAYYMGISDFNYISLTDIQQERDGMKQVVVPETSYSINFDDIEKIAMPVFFVGPWGKDYHTMTERVHLPFLEHISMDVIQGIIDRV